MPVFENRSLMIPLIYLKVSMFKYLKKEIRISHI